MANVLPQQRLLLELLVMSGEIAVPESAEGTLLWTTLLECRSKGWIRLTPIGTGMQRIDIADLGRSAVA